MTEGKKEKRKHLERLKRIKFLNEFLMFFGTDKIGFKFPHDENKKHYTLKFLREGVLDFHETIEGTVEEKKYPRVRRLNIKKSAETIRETFRIEFPKILKEIDISDPKYEDVNVVVFPTREEIRRAIEPIEVKKKEIRIEKYDISDKLFTVPMKDLQKCDFQVAFWGEEGEEHFLFRRNGKYFLLTGDDFKIFLGKLREKLGFQDFQSL